LKETCRLHFQESAAQSFCYDCITLEDEGATFLLKVGKHSAKVTASRPKRPESPETSLGHPQISHTPALSFCRLQKIALILTALLVPNGFFCVWRNKVTTTKQEQNLNKMSKHSAFG
jgi:hypothetical protein